MKALYLLYTFLLVPVIGFSQINIDSCFIPHSAWSSNVEYGQIYTKDGFCTSYKIERDSIINGNVCHLISAQSTGSYHIYMKYGSDITTSPKYIDSGIFGAIRVDQKKVYFTLFNSGPFKNDHVKTVLADSFQVNQEKLLYNFDLKVGDTVPRNKNNVVIKIDSVLLGNGLYAKRFIFGTQVYGPFDCWIEGIGSVFDLFNPSFYETGLPFKNICYSSFYFNYTFTPVPQVPYAHELFWPCYNYFPTTINNVVTSSTSFINVSPNPMHSFINLELPGSKGTITILNTIGTVLHRTPVTSNNMRIETADYPNGIYFIRYSNDIHTQTVRVLKQ